MGSCSHRTPVLLVKSESVSRLPPKVPCLCQGPHCCWSVAAKASCSAELGPPPPAFVCVSSCALPRAASAGVSSQEPVDPAAIGASLATWPLLTGACRAAPLRTAAAGSVLATSGGTCGSAGPVSAACWRPSARPTALACDYRIPMYAARGQVPVLI